MNSVASADPITAHGVAVVSGAAGAIGQAVVSKLVQRHLIVAAVDRDEDALATLACRHKEWVLPVTGDTTTSATLDTLITTLETETQGTLHHVIAIAGGATTGELGTRLEDLDVTTFRNSIEANLVATWAFTKACLPLLTRTTGNRSLTFCTSRNALAGHGLPAYSAAKAGLHGLLNPLTVDLGQHGIRVNAVAPGQIATPFAQRYHANQPGHFDRIANASSLGRLAKETDVADAFIALALDLQAVTGQTLIVDAGAHVWRGA